MNTLIFVISFWIAFVLIKVLSLIAYLARFKYWRDSPKHKSQPLRVLYLAAFFPENAGYHYRVLKWAEVLEKKGVKVTIVYATEKEEYDVHIENSNPNFLIKYMFNRIWQILLAPRYDTIIVRRELLMYNDYGNLFLEKFLQLIHRNIILDFDDDLSAAKREPRSLSTFGTLMLEHPAKFKKSLTVYKRYIVGSNYLKEMILDVNPKLGDENILVIPTCVDYNKDQAKSYERKEHLNFGWIGNSRNLKLLTPIISSLNEIAKKRPIKLIVISGESYNPDVNFELINIPWNLSTELESLYRIDVGLMPLDNNAVSRGKCGFKLIQYMGLGIVSVATALTINKEIVEDGTSGFLVEADGSWQVVLENVLSQYDNFSQIGAKARAKIESNYSFNAHEGAYYNYLKL